MPSLWLDAGKFVEIPGIVYAHFPMNTEMLYGTALALRGEIAAKAFHWLFAVLAALAVRSLARTWAGPAAARWAPVLFLAIPTVFRVATWAYVELAGICYLLLAWLLIVRVTRAAGRDALVAGLLGVACGIKYTFLLPAVVIVLFTVVQAGGAAPLRALVGLGAALAGGGFWYVRNIVTVGNPCYPFLYSIFGGEGWDERRAAVFQGFLEFWGSDLRIDPVTVTYGATFSSIERLDGIVGPAFLLGLPLVAIAIARRPAVRPTAALAGLLLASWFFTTHQIRFLVPALAFLAVLIPVGWQAIEGASLRRMAHGLVVTAVLLALPSQLLLLGQSRPLAYAIGLESDDQFLDRHIRVGDYEVYRRLPEHVPADGRVLFAGSGNPVYLCARPFHADSVDENHTLRELLRASAGPADFARRLQADGFAHLLFRADVVLGDLSDLEVRERTLLGAALQRHGELVLQRGGTYPSAMRARTRRPTRASSISRADGISRACRSPPSERTSSTWPISRSTLFIWNRTTSRGLVQMNQ